MGKIVPAAFETITKRFDCTYLGTDIVVDDFGVRGAWVHLEGSTGLMNVSGTLDLTESDDAVITTDGFTFIIDREFAPGVPIMKIKTPTALGGEKVTNGDFGADTWTKGTGWSVAGGKGVCTPTASIGTLSQNVSASASTYYVVTYKLVLTAGSSMSVKLGGVDGVTRYASGTYTEEILTTGTGHLIFTPSGDDVDATLDDVSVKAVTTAKASLVAWR